MPFPLIWLRFRWPLLIWLQEVDKCPPSHMHTLGLTQWPLRPHVREQIAGIKKDRDDFQSWSIFFKNVV